MKINFSEILREAFGQKVHYENNNVQKNFEIIKKAIQTGGVIQFYYLNVDGLPKNQYRLRFVEPFELGTNVKGNMVLSGYWVSQFSKSGNIPKWRLYSLSNIKQLKIVPRKQRIVRDLWAGGTHKLMTKVLVSISNYFTPKTSKKDMEKINIEKRKKREEEKLNKKLQKSVYQEPTEKTGEFEEDDLTKD